MLSLSVPFKAQPGAVASELCGLMAETFIQLCDCANYSVIVDSLQGWSSIVVDAIKLTSSWRAQASPTRHKARAAISGLSGQRHGRYTAATHPPVREPRGRPIFFNQI